MVGAVVTSQRALLVSVTLRVLAAASLMPGPTSALWVGPALLVTNAAQQVTSAADLKGVPSST